MKRGYFNDEQLEYMDSLAKLSAEDTCYCGWNPIGKCQNCPPGKTAADKIAAWCPECRGAPSADGARPLVHRVGCSKRPT